MQNKHNAPRTGLGKNVTESLHRKLDSLVESLLEYGIDLDYARKQLERGYIQALLRDHQGNIGQTARALGVHRNTLSKRIRDLDITVSRAREV